MKQKLLLLSLGFIFLFQPLGCKRETRYVLVENGDVNQALVDGETLEWKGNADFYVHFLQQQTPCIDNANDLHGDASTAASCKTKTLPKDDGLINYSYVLTQKKWTASVPPKPAPLPGLPGPRGPGATACKGCYLSGGSEGPQFEHVLGTHLGDPPPVKVYVACDNNVPHVHDEDGAVTDAVSDSGVTWEMEESGVNWSIKFDAPTDSTAPLCATSDATQPITLDHKKNTCVFKSGGFQAYAYTLTIAGSTTIPKCGSSSKLYVYPKTPPPPQ